MFLAIKEIEFSKFKYLLVIGLLFLISYLVFFLTGLANGLAQANRSAIDLWKADDIVLVSGVENRIQMSTFPAFLVENVEAKEKAKLGLQMALFKNPKEKGSLSAQLLGIEKDAFIAPKIEEGKLFEGKNEVVVPTSFLEKEDLKIGDKLTLNNTDVEFTIVGSANDPKLSVQPAFYMDLKDFQALEITPGDAKSPLISAVVTQGATKTNNDQLEANKISDFINDLPGYGAQNATFGMMIGFLIVIAAFVIGIFIYVLTLQKESVFGIMKAQGISNGYLIGSVLYQTLLLSGLGILLGLFLNWLSALFLPASVPFDINWVFTLSIAGLILLFAALGGLFSSRMITKIDPLDAI